MKKSSYTTINVTLKDRSYPIYTGKNIFSSLPSLLKKYYTDSTIVIITDTKIASLYLKNLLQIFKNTQYKIHTIIIPQGEQQKNLQRANSIYTELLRKNIDRNATIIGFGGGVIGDLAGFVAATYQRGVRFIQIPTTLLAQVDSSVGGKVGINHPLGKNMIGAFWQPKFVLSDVRLLETLPQRELICGIGEVIKYGIILDKDFFSYTIQNLQKIFDKDFVTLEKIISQCCTIKSRIVSQDEKENNIRAILNFGHTIGHALEKAGNYKTLKHGEAVLLGMLAESFIAKEMNILSQKDFLEIEQVICTIPIFKKIPLSFSSELLENMQRDKKTRNGKIHCVLPKKIGSVLLPQKVKTSVIKKSLTYLFKLQN